MPQLTLYDFNVTPEDPRWETYSPFVMKVSRALRLAQLPFDLERIAPQAIKTVNPLGQLPALRIDETLVTDSTDILGQLDALTRGKLTEGLSEAARAEAWLWEDYADSVLYGHALCTRWGLDENWAQFRQRVFAPLPAALRSMVAGTLRKKALQRLKAMDVLRAGRERWETRLMHTLDHLDARAPAAGFWMGPQVTVADLGIFAQLHSLRLPEAGGEQAAAVGERTRLAAYLDRVETATR